MYDDYHDRLFADKGNFKPQDGNIVLEVADHKVNYQNHSLVHLLTSTQDN
jgi:hypothetical protein